jgi:hypothetical protein
MKYNKNDWFKCIIFIRLILDTTFLLTEHTSDEDMERGFSEWRRMNVLWLNECMYVMKLKINKKSGILPPNLYNFFTLKTPQNIYPSWRKNRTKSLFSKPNFDMQGPICCKSYNFNGYPQLFIFVLVQKNIYSLSAFCTRLLTSFPAEIWFFKISDRGCRAKGPLPKLRQLTVVMNVKLI